jgi:hypothetical protein
MKKELALAKSPVAGYQHHLYTLSILLNLEQHVPWVHNHYVLLKADAEDRLGFNFVVPWYDRNPCLDCEVLLRREIMESERSAIELITGSINQDKYVVTAVDEFYIPRSTAYKSMSFKHDIMIYGYDDVKESLKVLRYNDKDQIAKYEITYKEFLDAFEQSPLNEKVYILQPDASYIHEFDLRWLYIQLEDYVHSQVSYEFDTDGSVLRISPVRSEPSSRYLFGRNTGHYLFSLLEALSCNKPVEDAFIPFHIFYEQKKCMAARLAYLHDNGFIEVEELMDKYKELETLSCALRNALLRYLISHNEEAVQGMKHMLQTILTEDEAAMKRLMEIVGQKIEDTIRA